METVAPQTIPAAEPQADREGLFLGQSIRYRVIAEEIVINNDQDTPAASFFAISYLASDLVDLTKRPVTFAFNGGPGSSSLWLHVGGFGPMRVEVPSDALHAGAPPYEVVPNSHSLLGVTDLVFIDPVGTGFSRAIPPAKNEEFWGIIPDAESLADFVQAWITRHARWNSPKYLAGESYGTTRACLIADLLCDRFIAINGLILIAAVLDYQNSRPRLGDGAILSYASFLPSFAAVAYFHSKVRSDDSLEEFLRAARTFALETYVHALASNVSRLSESELSKIVDQLAAFTGLEPSYIQQSNLRVTVNRFCKELLREEGKAVGRLDGRYRSDEIDRLGEQADTDCTFDAIGSAFNAAFNTLLTDLGIDRPDSYIPVVPIHDEWNWLQTPRVPNGGGYVTAIPTLARVMRRNPDLRVLVASAYYDLATPFFGAENALSQDGIRQERVDYTYYRSGHMIFLHKESREQLLQDIRDHVLRGQQQADENIRTSGPKDA